MSEEDQGDAVEPDPTDPFDGLVLDETFVREAAVREAPAHVRARPAPRSQLPPRRSRRARAWTRVTSHPVPVLLVLVIGAAVVAGLLGAGPLAGLHHSRATGQAATTTTARATSSSIGDPTTSELTLKGTIYGAGQCATWEQGAQAAQSAEATRVVSCSAPHLTEMVGPAQAPDPKAYGSGGPTAAQWVAIEAQVCDPLVVRFLGVPLDPAGRFYAGAITPTPDAWASGYRTMWCGVYAHATDGGASPNDVAFTGEARGAPQALLLDTGLCVAAPGPSATGSSRNAVPCTSPHDYEVTGVAKLPATVTAYPSTPSEWTAAVSAACEKVAVSYHGGPIPSPLEADWLVMAQSSWNLGQRTLNCTIGAYDGSGNPLSLSGSARAGGVPR